jgi:hypothetical protein
MIGGERVALSRRPSHGLPTLPRSCTPGQPHGFQHRTAPRLSLPLLAQHPVVHVCPTSIQVLPGEGHDDEPRGAPTSVVGPGRPLRPTLPSEVEAIPPDDKSGDVLPSGASSRSTSLDPRTHSSVPTPDRNVESARSTSPPLNSPARVRMLHTALTSAFRLIGDARVALVKGVRHGGHADQRT